jgi:hypothetical protein
MPQEIELTVMGCGVSPLPAGGDGGGGRAFGQKGSLAKLRQATWPNYSRA